MIAGLVVATVLAVSSTESAIFDNRTEEDFLEELKIYRNLDELLFFFKNETNPLAHQILETFERDCRFVGSSQRPQVKPVIVIEGNHKSSRDVIMMGLTELLNGRYVTHPAPCLHKYHRLLPKGSLLRRSFYLLSNYAGSFYAKSQLSKPIVINGYWTEQLAFTLSHFYPLGQLPPITSEIFNFPPDLLKPDLIFYLNFPDKLIYHYVTTKSPLTWKPKMLDAFRHMQGKLPIVMMDVKPLFRLTTEEIHRYIHEHLYEKLFGIRNLTGAARGRRFRISRFRRRS